MDITRNQYFLFGLILLFLGVELLMLDSVTFTQEFTAFLAKRTNHPVASLQMATDAIAPEAGTIVPAKTITPPDWTGWSLVSLGSVLVLHSLAMKKPGS
jgi:hypothetical protein